MPPTPAAAPDDRWAALRQCWLELLHVHEDMESLAGPTPQQQEALAALAQRHRQALDALVAAGTLDAAVAAGIAVALEQIVEHRERSLSLCYIAFPAEQMPRQDLQQQLALLDEMAAKSVLSPSTVEKARAALERDVEWLTQFQAGQVPGPLGNLEAGMSARDAARVLVELLLGQ
jgi:predicted GNAT family acetyltransferase